MSATLLLAQVLNGLQYGVMLFLLAAGLTLVFGIMSFVNLAHGSLYMLGAYAAAVVGVQTGSFALSVLAALATGVGLPWGREVTQAETVARVTRTRGVVIFALMPSLF